MNLLKELSEAKKDDADVIKEILSRHEIEKPDLKPVILWAAGNGYLEVVKQLLTLQRLGENSEYIANKNAIAINDAFHIAAISGHLDVVKHLLMLDSPKVDYTSNNHYTFQWAAKQGELNVIAYLLTLPKTNPSAGDFQAVMWAIEGGHLPVVEAIGRWINAKGTKKESDRFASILSDRGVVVNYETLVDELKSAKMDEAEVVKEILSRHQISKPDLKPVILWAAENGHLEVVKQLLMLQALSEHSEFFANKNAIVINDAFHIAAISGHLDIVKHLLTLDSPKVDYTSNNHYTFQWAAKLGKLNVIAYLLTLPKTNPSAGDFQAVIWALEGQHLPVVEAISRWVRTHGTDAQRNRLDAILGNRGVVINYEQSTHAASVHKSVSESATRLMTRYGNEIKGDKLNTVLETMVSYANSLPSSTDVTDFAGAAQRYLAGEPTEAYPRFAGNVISPQSGSRFLFADPGSNITTQQVLALTYLATIDEKAHPLTSAKEVLEHFLRGLYEARRGYNLNDKNIDNGLADRMICPAGAFNKAIEALATLHPDCEIILVTKMQAGMKLPKVVEAEAYAYLAHRLEQAQSPQQLEGLKTLLAKVKEEGISVILPEISNKITTVIFEEFGSLYNDDVQNANFQALIGTAEYVGLDESKLDALVAETLKRLNDVETSGLPETSLNTFTPGHSGKKDGRNNNTEAGLEKPVASEQASTGRKSPGV